MNRSIPSMIIVAAVLLASITIVTAASQAEPPDYHVSMVVPLGTPDRWDYVVFDPDTHRVYVAHGDRVTVVDGNNGYVVGTVEGMPGGTHGIAVSHATGKGYTDDGKAGVVVIFDLTTFKVLKQIKADIDADGIVFDPASGHIFVIDGDSGKLTVIDPKTDALVATVDGGGGLEFGDTGNNGKFYVDGAEKNEIVRVDTAMNVADAHWPMPTCVKPHGLAIDREHRRLFASCSNKVMVVMNADNGAVMATLPIGEGTDFASFDPKASWRIAQIATERFRLSPKFPPTNSCRYLRSRPKSGHARWRSTPRAAKSIS